MNALQQTEFNILKEVIRICDELNLTYYLVCGSALGAVKYDGFIPWDDDVDIGLPRIDYEVFCEKAQALLQKRYFLQNYRTEQSFPTIYSKVRDCETTFIEHSARRLPINQGVYIDIFPLDGYPNDPFEAKRLELRKTILKIKLSCSYGINEKMSLMAKMIITVLRLFGCHRRSGKYAEKLTELISAFPFDTSKIICNHGNWQGKLDYASFEQYGNGTWASFEGLKVRIPEKYDEYLTQKYGEWRAALPPEQQVGHHYAEVIDLNQPYMDYIDHLPNRKIQIEQSEE